MLMSAWDARYKICPRTMHLPEEQRSKCISYDCQAWNWGDDVSDKTEFTSVNKGKFPGFCGDAGKPVCKAMITKDV